VWFSVDVSPHIRAQRFDFENKQRDKHVVLSTEILQEGTLGVKEL